MPEPQSDITEYWNYSIINSICHTLSYDIEKTTDANIKIASCLNNGSLYLLFQLKKKCKIS